MSATEKTNCPIYLHDRYCENENKELQLNRPSLEWLPQKVLFVSAMVFILIFTLHVQSKLNFECVIILILCRCGGREVQYTESLNAQIYDNKYEILYTYVLACNIGNFNLVFFRSFHAQTLVEMLLVSLQYTESRVGSSFVCLKVCNIMLEGEILCLELGW